MHTITIKNFNFVASDDSDSIEYNSNYGLFDTIYANSIVKHLTVNYDGLVDTTNSRYLKLYDNVIYGSTIKSTTLNAMKFNLSSFNFGGVCVTNQGVIYNTTVTPPKKQKVGADGKPVYNNGKPVYEDVALSFINNVSSSVQIGGLVANNAGYISYSQSNIPFTSNCGYVGGFAAVNTKKISNSKVVFSGTIQNTLTTSTNALTGGFVARNSGEIFGSYVSIKDGVAYSLTNINEQATGNEPATISANSYVGGFVNQNSGTIKNSYSNIVIKSETRSSGFVYNNSGTIISSYSSSKIEESNSAHSPFTGTDSSGAFINTGTIDDCYYIGEHNSYEKIEFAKQISIDAAKSKYQFAKFVFIDEGDDYRDTPSGTWRMDGVPKLVDADLNIYSQEIYQGLAENGDKSYYYWSFEEADGNPGFGQISNDKSKINPRIINSLDTWNKYISNDYTQKGRDGTSTTKDYFVVVKDITADNLSAPKTTEEIDFEGKILGSNMKISNLYLRADPTNTNKTYGLFKTLNKALIKDLNIEVRQIAANNANCVGVLSGYIESSTVININIDATNVVVQGKNMVGVFAGIINNSTITNIEVKGHVNASYLSDHTQIYNYLDSDFNILTNNTEAANDVPYSYAGVFAGAILGDKSVVKLINVTGDNKAIAYHAGTLAGIVGIGAKLVLGKVKVATSQYINAYNIAGGLVAENRGTIDRCFVENIEQQAIDANISNTYEINRNLNFFINSPIFAGGLVGFNNGGTILNSYSKLDVRTTNYVTQASGGLVGLDVGGKIDSCYVTGSVINRNIIGGIIGVVTNKTTLIGYKENTINAAEDSTSYSRINTIFASNYFVTSGSYTTDGQRGAYVAGSLTNLSGDQNDENLLSITNTLASNKWIVNVDESYIEAINSAGLFIGEVVDAVESDSDIIKANFDPTVYDGDSWKADNNNFINTQILKDNIITTAANIQANTMINAFIEDKLDSNNDIIEKLENFSIGFITNNIRAEFLKRDGDKIYNIAKCDVEGTIVSFENILNLDDLLLNGSGGKIKYDVSKLSESERTSGEFTNKVVYIKDDQGNYIEVTNVYEEYPYLDYDKQYNSDNYKTVLPKNIEEIFRNLILNRDMYYKNNGQYIKIEGNNISYLSEISSNDSNFDAYKIDGRIFTSDTDGKYILVDPTEQIDTNGKYYTKKIINSYEEFLEQKNDLYYLDQSGQYLKVTEDNLYYEPTDWNNISENDSIYIKPDNIYINLKIWQDRISIFDNQYIGITFDSDGNGFSELQSMGKLYYGGLDAVNQVTESDEYHSTIRYFIRINGDDNDLSVYKLNNIDYYTLKTFYVRNYNTLYVMPTFYIYSYGIYTNYSPDYFILPDKDNSATRFYPEIIENINSNDYSE
jgi:hypothetical protein